MTMASLFSGTDISGRDELFTRGSPPSLLDEFFADALDVIERAGGLVVRAATVFTIATVALTSTAELVPKAAVEFPKETWTLRDEITAGILSASSQITQPNEAARNNALVTLKVLRSHNLEPHRVVGDPDGGIALYMFGGNAGRSKFARVLATNEGDIIAMCADDAKERLGLWASDQSELDKTAARIESFIVG